MKKFTAIFLFIIAFFFVFFSQPDEGALQEDDEGQVLSFWGIYDLPDLYGPIIEVFEKEHPQIKVSYRQFPNMEEYHQVLIRQLEKGKGPDIFLFPSQHRDIYLPSVTPTSADLAEGFAPLVEEDLVENRLLYGLPLWVNSLMLYYNSKVYPDGIARDWYAFAEQTKGLSTSGIAMGRLDNINSGWDILRALFAQKELRIAGRAVNGVFDILEFYTRFAYPIDRYYNWNEQLTSNAPDLEIDSFVQERVGAIAGYPSLYGKLVNKSEQRRQSNRRSIRPEHIAVAPFPQFDAESPRYLGEYMALSVSIHSDIPNQSWEFVELLTNDFNAQYYREATKRIPGRVLEPTDADSLVIQVQQQQLPYLHTLNVSLAAQEKIEKVVKRGLKDKRLLREIFDVEL